MGLTPGLLCPFWAPGICETCTTKRDPEDGINFPAHNEEEDHRPETMRERLDSMGQSWREAFRKLQKQVSPSPEPVSPEKSLFDSDLFIGDQQRIETVADWPMISRKYRALQGKEEPVFFTENYKRRASLQF